MWIDVKTGKPLRNVPPPVYEPHEPPSGDAPGTYHPWTPPTGGGDTWFNDYTGQNAAWDEGQEAWIDVKTGKRLRNVPPAIYEPHEPPSGDAPGTYHPWTPPAGGGDTWFNEYTGQNAAWVPDEEPQTGGKTSALGVLNTPLIKIGAAVAAAATAIGIGIGIALMVGGGGGNGPAQDQPAVQQSETQRQPTPQGQSQAPGPATQPVLSGTYDSVFVVDSNAGQHPPSLEGGRPVELLIVRDRAVEPNPVTIEMTVNPTLTGATQVGPSFNERGGDFSASATAPYEGYQTTWVFQGSVIDGQGISGQLTIGGDGGLPGGQPIAYGVQGTRR